MNIETTIKSPNYSSRDGAKIDMFVLHSTAGTYNSDIDILTDGTRGDKRVSAHYYITKGGIIYNLVNDANAAWHAGVSAWDGKNSLWIQKGSIGVELENLNNGSDPYPKAQYDALVWLTRMLNEKYRFKYFVRHSDIAPARKTDPRGFDWAGFLSDVKKDAVWDKWGEQHPLPRDQRDYGIPQTWKNDNGDLGEATSPELYIPQPNPQIIVRTFANGIIWGFVEFLNTLRETWFIGRK